MPKMYQDFGGPLRWQDEQSGQLIAAVHAYFRVSGYPPITHAQFELVRDYAEYYINAPCWDSNPYNDDASRKHLEELRQQVKDCKTDAQLESWLLLCLEVGLDPF
jgi:hypothetical protein